MRTKLLLAAGIAITTGLIIGCSSAVLTVKEIADAPVVVVDAGHGGLDGGAQSDDGVIEKDINLKIATFLRDELKESGFKVIMTREEDVGLYSSDSQGSIRSLKSEDIRKRKDIIDSSECDLAISIHLNSFKEDISVRGGQIFYSGDSDELVKKSSQKLAELLQSKFNETINKASPRSAMEKSDVYILQNVNKATILVECGFLSNADESCKLTDISYQRKIAQLVAECVTEQFRYELVKIP